MQRGARTRISDRPTLDAESTELATALTSGMPTRPISLRRKAGFVRVRTASTNTIALFDNRAQERCLRSTVSFVH